jgi:hypothetical protein
MYINKFIIKNKHYFFFRWYINQLHQILFISIAFFR